ncbi:MAG: hypothetical protein DRP84_07855 [Spirochaetes bacterium]|nr:MAG: hypothetical protein DRP84_07855 [Spirochaetota bacterium]RKY02329.1 MAG: hypothetical protein DRP55_03005 [Spirochaetota bacterium]
MIKESLNLGKSQLFWENRIPGDFPIRILTVNYLGKSVIVDEWNKGYPIDSRIEATILVPCLASLYDYDGALPGVYKRVYYLKSIIISLNEGESCSQIEGLFQLYRLDSNGEIIGKIPVRWEDNIISVEILTKIHKFCYYLLKRSLMIHLHVDNCIISGNIHYQKRSHYIE